MSNDSPVFSERLWPSPALMVILLLLVPAVTLMLTPLNATIALPVAIIVYALISLTLVLMSPVIRVQGQVLYAGRAKVDAAHLGDISQLESGALKSVLGPHADARAYLLIRGYIHRGIKIEIQDHEDPTPYWVLTTRRPTELTAALETAKTKA